MMFWKIFLPKNPKIASEIALLKKIGGGEM